MDPVSQIRLAFNGSSRLTRGIVRWSITGGLLLACLPGCRTWSDASDHNVGLQSAWHASNGNDQKIECSYREGWRAGYLDSREGTNRRLENRVPAQFEAFHSHLREQTWSDWRRGYNDGHASAAQQMQQQDPHGFHQQAFQVEGPSSESTPPTDPSQLSAPPELMQPTVPEATPPAPPTPPTPPQKPKKYIDQDRVAGDWGTLGQSIQRTVEQHHAQGRGPAESDSSRSVPAITISSADSSSPITLPLRAGNPVTPSTSGPVAEAEKNIHLPTIHPETTFGRNEGSSLPTLATPAISEPVTAPEMNLPSVPAASASPQDFPALDYEPAEEDLQPTEDAPAEELDLELNLIQTYPDTHHQPLVAQVSPLTFAARDLPPVSEIADVPEQSVSAAREHQTLAPAAVADNEPLASTMELSDENHQMVDYQSQLGPNNGLPSLSEPQSVILTPRQRIRRQLPSRLPLKRRLPNG